MKRFIGWKSISALVGALFFCGVAGADSGHIVADTSIVPNPIPYTSTFSVRADGINWASAQVVVTSQATPAQSFTGVFGSSFSITVSSWSALSTATAAGFTIAITSDAGTSGQSVSIAGYVLTSGNQWQTDIAYSSNTCYSLAAAFAVTPATATCTGVGSGTASSTVTINANNWGSAGNYSVMVTSYPAMYFKTYDSSSTTIGIGHLTGGKDAQTFTIGGTTIKAGVDFFPATSNAVTATNIASAINTAVTSNTFTAQAISNVVTTTADIVGIYAIASSSQAAAQIAPYTSSSPITGLATGSTYGPRISSYTYGGSNIVVLAHKYSKGEQVWLSSAAGTSPLYYSTAAAGVGTALGQGTSYYVIVNDPNDIALSTVAPVGAGGAGMIPLVYISSNPLKVDTYTLNVSSQPTTPNSVSWQWVVSNDNTNWTPLTTTSFGQTIGSGSVSTYVSTGTVATYDFGHFNYGYLGLSVTTASPGMVNVKDRIIGHAP